jgi:hypothetical protein
MLLRQQIDTITMPKIAHKQRCLMPINAENGMNAENTDRIRRVVAGISFYQPKV